MNACNSWIKVTEIIFLNSSDQPELR